MNGFWRMALLAALLPAGGLATSAWAQDQSTTPAPQDQPSAAAPAQDQSPPAPAPAPTAQDQQPAPAPAPAATAPAEHQHVMPADAGPAPHQRQKAPADAYVYIGWPNDGEVIRSTRFKVWFGARNIGIAPAGVNVPNTGHHHLLIDVDLPDPDEPIPNDKNHLHYGLGQTEAMVDLPPGRHTLQLLLGDADHVPFDPPLASKKIVIYVRPGGGGPVASH